MEDEMETWSTYGADEEYIENFSLKTWRKETTKDTYV